MKFFLSILVIIPLYVSGQSAVDQFSSEHLNNDSSSISHGTHSNGSLSNGKLFPFSGTNFFYFDTLSYINSRAFCHSAVRSTLLSVFSIMDSLVPDRKFGVMELSNKNGGKIPPHRTHQNGLSVDLMIPLVQKDIPYTKLDHVGRSHYLLEFDNHGRLSSDSTIRIDFEVLARYILTVEASARDNGLRISKLIINTELKDELFKTDSGKLLKSSGIYIVKALEPVVNSLHDDHVHLDFELLD